MGVIPIASDQGPREMIHSLRHRYRRAEKRRGRLHFPGRADERIGQMLPFRRGDGAHHQGRGRPIIPVNLDGVYTIFSFAAGVSYGNFSPAHSLSGARNVLATMPPTSTSLEVRRAYRTAPKLSRAARSACMRCGNPLLHGARHPLRFAMADDCGPGSTISGPGRALVLARRLPKTWQGQEMVGILLPHRFPGRS